MNLESPIENALYNWLQFCNRVVMVMLLLGDTTSMGIRLN